MKRSETWIAWSSRPPGLLRRSSTSPLSSPLFFLRSASSAVVQVVVGVVLEALDPDVADAVGEQLRGDALDLDDGARQREAARLGPALAQDPYAHLGAGLAAQALHGLVESSC